MPGYEAVIFKKSFSKHNSIPPEGIRKNFDHGWTLIYTDTDKTMNPSVSICVHPWFRKDFDHGWTLIYTDTDKTMNPSVSIRVHPWFRKDFDSIKGKT